MKKILIAEDDPMMSHLYQKVFELEGYKVHMAANGQQAIDQARQHRPHLIVLDVMMPVLNGLDALEQLKADPKLKTIPVVMLTNLGGEENANVALSKGAVRYITKSQQDAHSVVETIKEILKGASTDR